MLMLCALGFVAVAQDAQLTPLPLDSKVRHGVLDNGMNYYILHNEKPEGKANFYIAQRVGSSLETEKQLGLAHFLEHMAFNGSKNYPGKNMLNYLQSKGIRFGADINAYTGFDETVYNIDNIPTSDQALVDSVLLVLHDWSGSLLLEDAEIDAERGVIQEEWRSRNSWNTRMWTTILPQIYKEYQYARMPIGTMEVVMNFPYQDLRDYYHKWYRPDQQGIIIVGDFDVDEMEAKVKKLMSTIPMPENAAERTYPAVSDNDEPIYTTFADPEVPAPMALFCIKYDGMPRDQKNTMEYLMQETALTLVAQMINHRFEEMANKADCKFQSASVEFGQFLMSATKEALTLEVTAKGDLQPAFEEALAELVRSCKTGFTDSEFSRAKDELLQEYEREFNERDKTTTSGLARRLIRTFIDNTPNPGIENIYPMMQQVLPMIPVQALNAVASQVLDTKNQVLVVMQPQKEGTTVPAKDDMLGIVNDCFNRQYEAYVDEVIDEDLIPVAPKEGKIVKKEDVKGFDATKYTLSNGATVYVKTTDFKADQIIISADAPLGKKLSEGNDVNEMTMIEDAVEASKMNNFDINKMQKYLAGKNVELGFSMGMNTCGFSGSTSVKDLPVAMECLYSYFTGINPDEPTYKAQVDKFKVVLANIDKNPMAVFQDHMLKAQYNNPYITAIPTLEQVENADYNKMLQLFKERVQNAADYTFYFVGNVDAATIEPLLCKYVASLPGNAKKTTKSDTKFNSYTMKGAITDDFEKEMESPQTMVYNSFTGNEMPGTLENKILLEFTADILDIIFTNTLREEEGGTYSPQCGSQYNDYTKDWTIYYLFFTGADSKDKLCTRAYDEFMKLLQNGATAEDFNKVKGAALNQYDINSKTNGYWLGELKDYNVFSSTDALAFRATVEKLTLDDLNKFMKGLYNGKDRIQVVMNGVLPADKK